MCKEEEECHTANICSWTVPPRANGFYSAAVWSLQTWAGVFMDPVPSQWHSNWDRSNVCLYRTRWEGRGVRQISRVAWVVLWGQRVGHVISLNQTRSGQGTTKMAVQSPKTHTHTHTHFPHKLFSGGGSIDFQYQ